MKNTDATRSKRMPGHRSGRLRRTFPAAALAALAAVLLLTGCGSGDTTSGVSAAPEVSASAGAVTLTAEEQAWLSDKGTLRVGAFNDYPPFGFVDGNGEAVGIAADYWRLLGERLGVGVEFEPTLFDTQLQNLKDGTVDSLEGIFPLESRKEWFAFTSPFFDIPTRVFTDGATGITSLDDLKGVKVAVVKGDSGQQIADDAGLDTLVVPGYEEAVQAVGDGKAGAAILDQLVGEYFAAQLGFTGMQAVGEAVAEGQMTLPVQKDNAVLLGILEKGQQMISDVELQEIVDAWMEAK